MATAVAIQDAIARQHRDGDYENPQLGIVCFSFDNGQAVSDASAWRWVMDEIRAHHGAAVEDSGPNFLAVFPGLVDAVGYAKQLHGRFNRRIRIGVNLGEFRVDRDGRVASGSNFAKRLMEESAPGEVCISALAVDRITSRVRDDGNGRDAEPRWRAVVFATLQ